MGEPISDAEREALEALGYSEEWLESGVLERDLLTQQHQRLQQGGTRKTGKYRSQALSAWLASAGPIDDGQLDACLAFTATDPDAKLVGGAMAELIQSPRLSLEQLARIARSDPKLVRRHEGLIRRTYLSRRLGEGVSDEIIDQVLASKDASIQTKLVRDSRLSRKHAEALAKRGANPTIRANAQAWFQDKKSWK